MSWMEQMSGGRVPVIKDKDAEITNVRPHYTDERFSDKQTVFLDPEINTQPSQYDGVETAPEATYYYSDFIYQEYGLDEAREVEQEAKEATGSNTSASYFEEYLKRVMDKESLELVHIIAGVNINRGTPYQVFGVITPEAKATEGEEPSKEDETPNELEPTGEALQTGVPVVSEETVARVIPEVRRRDFVKKSFARLDQNNPNILQLTRDYANEKGWDIESRSAILYMGLAFYRMLEVEANKQELALPRVTEETLTEVQEEAQDNKDFSSNLLDRLKDRDPVLAEKASEIIHGRDGEPAPKQMMFAKVYRLLERQAEKDSGAKSLLERLAGWLAVRNKFKQ